MNPSVGRIVHYVSYGTPGGEFKPEHRAAIIAAVLDNDYQEMCSLVVFNPQGLFFNDCEHDEETKKGGTWHWPERGEDPHAPDGGNHPEAKEAAKEVEPTPTFDTGTSSIPDPMAGTIFDRSLTACSPLDTTLRIAPGTTRMWMNPAANAAAGCPSVRVYDTTGAAPLPFTVNLDPLPGCAPGAVFSVIPFSGGTP